MEAFIRNIPKAELHVHIEGTLEPELMFGIAQRNNIALPYKTVAEVRAAYHFTDLQSFLDMYYQSTNVLVHEQDFYDLAMAYLRKAKQQNIRHAEIFFDPQAHTRRGIAFETVIHGLHRALEEGETQYGVSAKLIMCFLRDLTEEDAFKTLAEAIPFKAWIVAVGLDSGEKGNPASKFQRVYAEARKAGFLAVAHAGEEGSAKNIWESLDLLHVARIDHGVHCMEDPKLVRYLVHKQIPLTVCPLSNVKLRVVQDMQDHPFKKMLELGLCATCNSDDPAYFGGYVNENLIAAQAALGLTQQEIYQMEKNAFLGSFISEDEKRKYLAELDEFYTRSNLL